MRVLAMLCEWLLKGIHLPRKHVKCTEASMLPCIVCSALLLCVSTACPAQRGELHLPRRRVGAVASMILNRAQDLYERGEMEASLR